MGLRGRVDNDVEHIFDAFEALGAVTSTHGVASEVFSEDLDEGVRAIGGRGRSAASGPPRCGSGWPSPGA